VRRAIYIRDKRNQEGARLTQGETDFWVELMDSYEGDEAEATEFDPELWAEIAEITAMNERMRAEQMVD